MGKKNRNAGTGNENNQVDVNVGGAGAESGAQADATQLDGTLPPELVVSQAREEGLTGEEDEGLVGDESDGKPADFENVTESPTPFEPTSASDLHQEIIELPVEGGEKAEEQSDAPVDEESATEPQGRYVDALLDPKLVLEQGQPQIDPEYGGIPGFVAEAGEEQEEEEEPTADEELAHAAEHLDNLDTAVEDATSLEVATDLRTELAAVLPEIAVRAWPEEYLILYKKTGKFPDLTKRGNLPIDIRRKGDLRVWTSTELEDWLDGFIKTPNDVEPEAIQAEVFKRWKLPGNWTLDAAKAYIFKGEKPAYTKSGVLVEDATRNNSAIAHWSYKDLRAALLGEIESRFSKDELVSHLRQRMGLNDSFGETALLKDLEQQPEVSMDNVLLQAKLEEYKVAMTKNPQYLTEETAGKAQKMLYEAIRKVMKRDPADFTEGWLILLNFINVEYNKLFYPERARLGWSQVGLNKTALTTFEDLLTLMIFSREPRTRKAAAQIYKPEQILRHVPDERERQNVINFYLG